MLSSSVARHGNGVYRPGKSGGDSESTPDTKPVAWAVAGRRGRACGKSVTKTKGGNQMGNAFIKVDDVTAVLGVSKSYAYKIVREMNNELKRRGFITIAGRVSKQYFEEKLYGLRQLS